MKEKIILQSLSAMLLFMVIACSPNNVKIDEGIAKQFTQKGLTGSFGLYDNGTGQFAIHNLSRFKDSTYSPASTFQIVNTLIGIETGKIVDENWVVKWDKQIRPIPNNDSTFNWNRDLTFQVAFKIAAEPVFQQIARSIGKDTLQSFLDTLHYGKTKIEGPIDSFWLNNRLSITADEQMGLVKKLYFNQLPFQKRSQQIVKKLMLQESNANYQLSYQTGIGTLANGRKNAWMIGWIEENKHPYFFVLNIESDQIQDFSKSNLALLKSILSEQGFFDGKK